jgi:hypothetical protein
MTAAELAEALNISRALLFKIRRRYPKGEYPASFNDIEAWRTFIAKARTDIRTTTSLPKPAGNGRLPSATESNIKFVAARAKEKAAAAELRELQLLATRRSLVHAEEVQLLFGQIAGVTRGRLLKMANDFPSLLAGLDQVAIDKIVQAKLTETLSSLALPEDFFSIRSVI